MVKLASLASVLGLLLFSLRVLAIGGLDPTFKEVEHTYLKALRFNLSDKIEQMLPYPQSAVLTGILLGDQTKLSFNLKSQLKSTSTIHIAVASGQNLSLVAGFLIPLTSLIGRGQTLLLTLLAIILYSLLTGLGVPIIRAGVMTSFTIIAQLLGKDKVGWWVLFLTGWLMLLYQPNWLYSLSFQLSFLATFAVVVVSPTLADKLRPIPTIIRQDVALSIAAWSLVLPIIAYNFGAISLAGIVVNSLILWTIPIIMASGFIALALSFISTVLGQIVGLVPSVLLMYFLYIVQFFSKQSWSAVSITKTHYLIWIGYYLVVWGGVLMLRSKLKVKT